MKLSVANLNSHYGPAHILFDIGLEVGEGEVVALLGRNGMGKTSLIRSVMGLASPQVRDNAFVLYIYSLCMSGQRAKAQAISSEAFAASGASSLPPSWVWMRDTFGIDPTRHR